MAAFASHSPPLSASKHITRQLYLQLYFSPPNCTVLDRAPRMSDLPFLVFALVEYTSATVYESTALTD